jgi:hypothetical protein
VTPTRTFILVHAASVALALGYSCGDNHYERAELPSVRLVAPAGDRPEYHDGCEAWAELGFRFRDPPRVECGRRWYDDAQTDCTITIGIVVQPDLIERTGSDAAAQRDFRTVYLDDDNHDVVLSVAHECGHILLDTPRHTQGGVMGGASRDLTGVDYELACETIGVCQ